jgi:hypothetical protein
MKITKHYLGREVRITWLDPCSQRHEIETALKGKAALAKWIERGIVDDLTDGVVRLLQSQAFTGTSATEPDEAIFGWIPEDLIESIELMEPVKVGEGI